MIGKGKGKDPQDSISDRAAQWHVKLGRGLSVKEKRDLEAELVQDEAFHREFQSYGKTTDLLESMSSELARELMPDEGELKKTSYIPWTALAAAIAIIFGVGLYWNFIGSADESDGYAYRSEFTADAAARTVRLPDGSLIRLNADSILKVDYRKEARDVELLKGEAHFNVAKDPERPFSVGVEDIRIGAIGTAFNVKRGERLDLIVTEGIVRVARANASGKIPVLPNAWDGASGKLEPDEGIIFGGQRAEIVGLDLENRIAMKVETVNEQGLDAALNWQESLLAIEGRTLKEIATDFELKTGESLVIMDPSLESVLVGGRFPSDDVPGFLRILKVGFGIEHRVRPDGVIELGREG